MRVSPEEYAGHSAAGTNGHANGDPPVTRPTTPLPRPRRLSRILARVKWLYPGMRVKRWILVVVLGILVMTAGVDLIFLTQLASLGDELSRIVWRAWGLYLTEPSTMQLTYQVIIGLPMALLGLLLVLYGVRNTLASVTTAVAPPSSEPIVDVIWKRRQLAQGNRIVAMGGGRQRVEDPVDPAVGFIFRAKPGNKVMPPSTNRLIP